MAAIKLKQRTLYLNLKRFVLVVVHRVELSCRGAVVLQFALLPQHFAASARSTKTEFTHWALHGHLLRLQIDQTGSQSRVSAFFKLSNSVRTRSERPLPALRDRCC